MVAFVGQIIYSYPKVQVYDDVFFRMANFAYAEMKFCIYLLLRRMETAICPVVGTKMSCVVVNQGCTSLHIYKEITYID